MVLKIFQMQVLILAVFLTKSALSIKCYTCNSSNEPDCSMSPPPKKYLQECSNDTLEILNDLHRQTKIQEAARIAALLNGSETSANNSGPSLPGILGNDAASAARPPAPFHPFDKDDKNLTLSRPARNAEAVPIPTKNDTEPGPLTVVPEKLPKEATFCRKTSYHIPTQKNGPNNTMKAHVRIIRSCGWIPDEKKDASKSSCKWIGTDGVQMDQCACTGDGCNAGNYMGSLPAQTMILMAVMTAGYFYVL